MTWVNQPRHWRWDGADLFVRTEFGTDFWHSPGLGRIHDSGHAFLAREQGDLAFEATVRGALTAEGDQMGLMLRLSNRHWVTLAVQVAHGTVVTATNTRDASDRSLHPLPGAGARLVRLRLERVGGAVSLKVAADGDTLRLVRMVPFPADAPVGIGPMCASPRWGGLEAHFVRCELEAAAPDWLWLG